MTLKKKKSGLKKIKNQQSVKIKTFAKQKGAILLRQPLSCFI